MANNNSHKVQPCTTKQMQYPQCIFEQIEPSKVLKQVINFKIKIRYHGNFMINQTSYDKLRFTIFNTYFHAISATRFCNLCLSIGNCSVLSQLYTWTVSSLNPTAYLPTWGCQAKHRTIVDPWLYRNIKTWYSFYVARN